MKIWIEINYNLADEPELLKNTENGERRRKTYIWENNRATIDDDGNYKSSRRLNLGITNQSHNEGLIEIWEPTDEPTPSVIDDSWEEEYKIIDYSKACLEWYPVHSVLKLCWDQQLESYQEGKVKSLILELSQKLQLNLPPLAKVVL